MLGQENKKATTTKIISMLGQENKKATTKKKNWPQLCYFFLIRQAKLKTQFQQKQSVTLFFTPLKEEILTGSLRRGEK